MLSPRIPCLFLIKCCYHLFCFFFNDTATPEIYTLSLHDALPISASRRVRKPATVARASSPRSTPSKRRSEEHTSELQSRQYLVCRLLLEKKKKKRKIYVLPRYKFQDRVFAAYVHPTRRQEDRTHV